MSGDRVEGFVCARCGLEFKPFRTWPVHCAPSCGATHHADGRMTRAQVRWWHLGDLVQELAYATGLAQCTELVWQLRGTADKRQVPNAKVALQHNLGLGGACVITMYRAD